MVFLRSLLIKVTFRSFLKDEKKVEYTQVFLEMKFICLMWMSFSHFSIVRLKVAFYFSESQLPGYKPKKSLAAYVGITNFIYLPQVDPAPSLCSISAYLVLSIKS